MQAFKSFTIGCVLGTRPEVIKMAPVIFQLQRCAWAKVVVINTGQHKDMLEDMLEVFNVSPDVNLNVMISNQSLGKLTANLCEKLDDLMKNTHFDALLAVGDTTTVFTTSLIAFYHRIPFGHIEAGLRTFNSQEPFPEEMNRTLTAPLATWHFAPTILEKENLLREQIPASKIVVTGNPVIDALFWVLKNRPDQNAYARDLTNIIVVTAHRRENFGKNLQNICSAMIELVARFEHIHFILPVHPNPSVQQKIEALLHKKTRIHLLPPIKYDEFTHLMQRSLFVLTDSGGIQEEAPALCKPVLVLRNKTERLAILTEGVGLLIGTETNHIIQAVSQLLTDTNMYSNMARGVSPYGDGNAAKRIVEALKKELFINSPAFSDSFVDI